MTRVINIVSGKGGVGKTTLTSNLAYVLSELGQDVVAIDANLTTPHLGLHLGLPLVQPTLTDVLRGDTGLRNAMHSHPLGFKVIPSSMNVNDLKGVDIGKLTGVTLDLIGKTDYVLTDCAPGLGRESISAIESSIETIIITTPELPSVADALKTARIAESTGKTVLGVVVNRVRGKWHELTKKEIEEMVGVPVLIEIPEDRNVSRSIAIKTPLVNYNPNSPASVEINRLAHALVGAPFKHRKPRNFRLLDRLIGWLTG